MAALETYQKTPIVGLKSTKFKFKQSPMNIMVNLKNKDMREIELSLKKSSEKLPVVFSSINHKRQSMANFPIF